MTQELSFPKVNVLSELAWFFEIAGFYVSTTTVGDEDGLEVKDKRYDNYSLEFTAKLSEDKRRLIITSYNLDCPEVRMALGQEFVLVLTDATEGKDIAYITYYDNDPIELDINQINLLMLVQHPIKLFVTQALSGREQCDKEFVKELSEKVNDYGEKADERMRLVIEYFSRKLS